MTWKKERPKIGDLLNELARDVSKQTDKLVAEPDPRPTFRSLWIGFRDAVYHDATPAQLRELEMTFHAGGFALLNTMIKEVANEPDDEDEGDDDYVESLYNEIRQFMDNVKKHMDPKRSRS